MASGRQSLQVPEPAPGPGCGYPAGANRREGEGEETDPGYIWPAASSLSIGLGEDSLGPSGGWEGRAWQVSSDWFLRPPGRSAAGEEARLRAPAAAFAG